MLRRRYRGRLLAVGVYGSTARGEDGPFSDLEMTAIIRGSGVDRRHEGIVRGMKYTVDVTTLDVVRRELGRIDIGWPLLADIYLAARPLYDPGGLYDRLRRRYARVVRGDFRPAIRREFVASFHERFCKFFNAAEAEEPGRVRYLAVYLFNWLLPFMGLVNKRHLGGATYRPERVLTMPATPPSFRRLGRLVLRGDLRDVRRVTRLVRSLHGELVRLTGTARALQGASRIRLGAPTAYG